MFSINVLERISANQHCNFGLLSMNHTLSRKMPIRIQLYVTSRLYAC